jgi:hypothetical protein
MRASVRPRKREMRRLCRSRFVRRSSGIDTSPALPGVPMCQTGGR